MYLLTYLLIVHEVEYVVLSQSQPSLYHVLYHVSLFSLYVELNICSSYSYHQHRCMFSAVR